MARVRDWDSLGDAQRHRYERSGISRSDYEAGVPLSAARGHGQTPEHPGQGKEAPRFRQYYDLRKEITQLKKEVFGHNVGKASQREMSKKGRRALEKARAYLQEMKTNGYSWDEMVAMYPELTHDEYDWIRHYH